MKKNPTSVDEARLRPHLRERAPEIRPAFYPVDNGVDEVRTFNPSFAPSPEDLRGIPVVGRGVGGVSPGTNPEGETVRKLTRESRAA